MKKFMVKRSELKNVCKAVDDRKLAELKKEIIEILKKQDEKDFKKATDYLNSQEEHFTHLEKSLSGKWIEKAGYGIGTIRFWKGKKYKKIAPNKWVRVFDKEGRGTNIAIGKLIAKVNKIDNVEDLMAFVMANKQRFVDENDVDLPVLDKLRAAVDARNGNVGSKETSKPAEKKSPEKLLKEMGFETMEKVSYNGDKWEVAGVSLDSDGNAIGVNLSPDRQSGNLKSSNVTVDDIGKIKKEKPAEKKTESISKQTDYYKDISDVLTKDEKRRINERVEKYSKENEWSISAADMKKFVTDWQSALKDTDKHAKAEKLYEIYSKLEDANWHDENKKLLAGNFEYFNDKYFEDMYGEEPEEMPVEKEDYKIAQSGKLATQKQVDYATEVSDKYSLTREEMLKKPITAIQKYANSTVEDFDGGIDKFIEYMADGRSEGVSLDEVGKEFGKLINHNIARKIWKDYESGALEVNDDGIFEPKKETKQKPAESKESDYVQKKREAKEGYWSDEFKERNMNNIKQKIADMIEDGASDKKVKAYLEETIETNSNDILWRERAIEEGRVKGNQANDYRDTIQERTVRIENCKQLLKEYNPKNDKSEETKTYWIQDSRGNRLTNEDAKKRIQSNLSKIIELESGDESRKDMKIRDLKLDNEYLKERLNPDDRKEFVSKVKKSLFDGFLGLELLEEDVDDMKEGKEEESLWNDYSAEEPDEFNSIELQVREAMNRHYSNCL